MMMLYEDFLCNFNGAKRREMFFRSYTVLENENLILPGGSMMFYEDLFCNFNGAKRREFFFDLTPF